MSKMKDYMMKHNLHLGDRTFDAKGDKMPNPLLKKYAAEAHCTLQHAEETWSKAKEIAVNSAGKDSPRYWATVNSITRKMLKLKEAKITFKDLLLLEDPNSE